jgi:secondary thiamine-phosphate synthase enzyme
MESIPVRTSRRCELVDVTDSVEHLVGQLGVEEGGVLVASPHTTAGVTVNEGYDPDVAGDLLRRLERLVPKDGEGDRHAEGNSDSHLKTAFVGSSVVVPVSGGRLALGRWQRVFFCEFDGPRQRELRVGRLSA